MARTIKIIIAEGDNAEREKLVKLLDNASDLDTIGEARSAKECLDLAARLRPDVVLLSRELQGSNGLDAAEKLTADMPQIAIVLVLNGEERGEVFHRMLRAGIKDFVTQPVEEERLLEEIRKAAKLEIKAPAATGNNSQPALPRNRIVTVAGPRGGCGKSVLATNLSVALATNSEKVALLDLNLWGGDAAMLLDVTPRRTLGDLLPGFGGIDRDVVESVVTKHNCGLSVLAAPLSGAFDGTMLSRYMVQSILDTLRDQYECTVVDTGYPNLESTLAAMDGADVILVVIGADLPRLRDGKHYLKNLMAANYPREKIRVVVNRATLSKEISATEIESILEFPVAARVPNDETSVSSSVNLGQPFVTASPQRGISRAIFALAEELAPTVAATGAGKKALAGKWFSFLH